MTRQRLAAMLLLAFVSVPSAAAPSATLDEVLAFACARDVASEVKTETQPGPLFYFEDLVFTSVSAAAPLLILNAGAGVFSVPLEHSGVNRIRFTIPTSRRVEAQTYFLSYLHDPLTRSRVFDFSDRRAPAGHTELDYDPVEPRRAPELLPQLEYAIWETSNTTVEDVRKGVLGARSGKVDCDYLDRKSNALSRSLRYNLAALEALLNPPTPSRTPASRPAQR